MRLNEARDGHADAVANVDPDADGMMLIASKWGRERGAASSAAAATAAAALLMLISGT